MKMKNLYRSGVGLVVGVFALTISSTGYAATGESAKVFGKGMLKNIEHSVEKITNGVVLTLTSTDAAVVAKLQSAEHPPKGHGLMDDSVTIVKENISNGVKVTMTSTDPEIVAKIQEGPKAKGMMKGMKGMKEHKDFLKDVTKSIEQITNGIVLTLTSTDADVVAKLQSDEHPKDGEKAGVSVSKVNIENGVKVTITSEDEEIAAKIKAQDGKKQTKVGKIVKKMRNGHNKGQMED
ncbi:MAG: hypothetical protein AAB373_05115 [Patescibacteria group bacterium]